MSIPARFCQYAPKVLDGHLSFGYRRDAAAAVKACPSSFVEMDRRNHVGDDVTCSRDGDQRSRGLRGVLHPAGAVALTVEKAPGALFSFLKFESKMGLFTKVSKRRRRGGRLRARPGCIFRYRRYLDDGIFSFFRVARVPEI